MSGPQKSENAKKPPAAQSTRAVYGALGRIRSCGLLIRSASKENCEASKINEFSICNNNVKMVFGFPVFVFDGFRFRLHIKFNDNQYMLATSASSSHVINSYREQQLP